MWSERGNFFEDKVPRVGIYFGHASREGICGDSYERIFEHMNYLASDHQAGSPIFHFFCLWDDKQPPSVELCAKLKESFNVILSTYSSKDLSKRLKQQGEVEAMVNEYIAKQ